MPFSQDFVLRKRATLGATFTPSAPISQLSLFAGRSRQIGQMLDALLQRGQHIVLYGERGVGKTSLATVIMDVAHNAGIEGMTSISINCTPADTFEDVWKRVFRKLEDHADIGQATDPNQRGEQQDISDTFAEIASDDEFGAEEVRRGLEWLRTPLIILDEFDQISDPHATMLIANTVKTLSDHHVGATLLLVGVADSVDELIREHASVERNLIQVHMPRMRPEELREIITRGLNIAKMTIIESAADRIVELSMGLPQYTHQLAKHAGYQALDRGSEEISFADVDQAIKECVEQAQASIQSKYHTATDSPRKDNLFKQVLLACALAKHDDLGYFSASDVCEPLGKILQRRVTTATFQQHLKDFCEVSRGEILQRKGKERSYRYRFANPMMRAHTMLLGYAKNMIPVNVSLPFSS